MLHCVYKITNTLNGKTYVGQYNGVERDFQWYYGSGGIMKKAVKKYGKENFKKEIIIKGDFNTHLMDELEKHYIRLYSPHCTINSYNIEPGGKRGYIAHNSKVIYQYSLDGTFIKEWRGVAEICNTIKEYKSTTITGSANLSCLSAYGFIWTYDVKDVQLRVSKINKNSRLYNKFALLQYDIVGNFIKEWESPVDAATTLNISYSAILNAVSKYNAANNFIWIRKDKNNIDEVLKFRKTRLFENGQKVSKDTYFIYNNGEWIEYLGAGIPSKILGISKSQLWKEIRTKHGYKIYGDMVVANRILQEIPTKNINCRKRRSNTLL